MRNILNPNGKTYRAAPCPCGHRACTSWHVWPDAAIQGVGFTKEQAEAVAHLLNGDREEIGKLMDLTGGGR